MGALRNGLFLGTTMLVGNAAALSLPFYQMATAANLTARGAAFVRNSHAWQYNSAGALINAPNNLIRNSTMQGAVVGDVELVTNGDFSNGLTGWTTTNTGGSANAWTWNGSAATVTGDGLTTAILAMPISVVSGQSYTVTFTAGGTASTQMDVATSLNPGGQIVASAGYTQGATYTVQFTAAATTTYYVRFTKFTNGNVPVVDNVSVRRTYVTNGDFSADPINAAQNVAQNGWTWNTAGGTTIAYNSGVVTMTGDGSAVSNFYTSFPTVPLTTYTLTIDSTGGSYSINVGDSAGNGGRLAQLVSPTGTGQVYQFTAGASTTFVTINKSTLSTTTIDNVRIRSAGVRPTNWSGLLGGFPAGLATEIVSLPTINGFAALGVRLFGVATAGGAGGVKFEAAANTVTAAPGQIFNFSLYLQTLAGAIPGSGLTLTPGIDWYNSTPTYITGASLLTITSVSALATLARFDKPLTAPAATAYAQPVMYFNVSNGLTVDWTFAVAAPQLEQVTAAQTGPGVFLPTSGAARYEPRFDYDPLSGVYSAGNRLTFSSDLSGWSAPGATKTSATMTGPLGDQVTVFKLVEDATTGEHYTERPVANAVGVAATWVDSYYVKGAERTAGTVRPVHSGEPSGATSSANFDLTANGGAGSMTKSNLISNSGIKNLGNGWYRVWAIYTTVGGSTSRNNRIQIYQSPGAASYAGTVGSGFYVYGPQTSLITATQAAQIVAANDPGAYLPTAGSIVGYPETVNCPPLGIQIEEPRTNSVRNNTMQGAVVGDVEMVSNTLNTTSIAGWTALQDAGGSTAGVVANGTAGLNITGTGVGSTGVSLPLQVVSGQSYTLTATVAGNALNVGIGTTSSLVGGSPENIALINAYVGTQTIQWTSAVTGTVYVIAHRSGASQSTLTNVSVRRQLVTNGDFALDIINAAQNTVQNGWYWNIAGGTSTVTWASGVVSLASDASANSARLLCGAITVLPSTTYTITFDSTGTVNLNVGSTQQGGDLLSANLIPAGTGTVKQFSTGSSQTTAWIWFANNTASTTATIDNVRLRAAGAFPTNWQFDVSVAGNQYKEVNGIGSENGVPYLDVRIFSGSANNGRAYFAVFPENQGFTAANATEFWNGSMFVKTPVVYASTLNLLLRPAGGTQSDASGSNFGAQAATANMSRYQVTTTAALATGATSISLFLQASSLSLAAPLDYSLRIGAPQMEKVLATTAKASSPILTYGAALTRAGDVPSVANPPDFRSKGTVCADVVLAGPSYGNAIVGDNNGSVEIGAYGATGDLFQSYDGTSVTSIANTTVLANTRYKIATAFSGSTRTGSVNGSAPLVTAFDGAFTGTTLYIGSVDGSQGFMNGWIRELRIYTADKGAGVQALAA